MKIATKTTLFTQRSHLEFVISTVILLIWSASFSLDIFFFFAYSTSSHYSIFSSFFFHLNLELFAMFFFQIFPFFYFFFRSHFGRWRHAVCSLHTRAKWILWWNCFKLPFPLSLPLLLNVKRAFILFEKKNLFRSVSFRSFFFLSIFLFWRLHVAVSFQPLNENREPFSFTLIFFFFFFFIWRYDTDILLYHFNNILWIYSLKCVCFVRYLFVSSNLFLFYLWRPPNDSFLLLPIYPRQIIVFCLHLYH